MVSQPVSRGLRALRDGILSLFFPQICPLCGEMVLDGGVLCRGCLNSFRPITGPICPRCGIPFDSGEDYGHLCGRCLAKGETPLISRSLFIYEGKVADAIHQLKYKGDRGLGRELGKRMGEALDTIFPFPPSEIDLVLPVPLSKSRLIERGFNQSLELARGLSSVTRIPVAVSVIFRTRETKPQTQLRLKERESNVSDAFSLKEAKGVKGLTILVVDDVITTGATINACSLPLLKAGAAKVFGYSLARALIH